MITEGEIGTVIFRQMNAEDIDEVYCIETLSFSLPWPHRAFEYEVIHNRAAHCRVLEEQLVDGGHRIVATTIGWHILDEFHVATIAVHPDFRGKGLGKILMLNVLEEERENGVNLVYLEVRRGNIAAQKLYKHFGFVETGVRKGYYADNAEDAILMTLQDLQKASF
jgi:[ribosomal protein S18]-alanine N-acetyltransferase